MDTEALNQFSFSGHVHKSASCGHCQVRNAAHQSGFFSICHDVSFHNVEKTARRSVLDAVNYRCGAGGSRQPLGQPGRSGQQADGNGFSSMEAVLSISGVTAVNMNATRCQCVFGSNNAMITSMLARYHRYLPNDTQMLHVSPVPIMGAALWNVA